tara:strand:- start:925 stop:1155 length:231 start_codon:yes stop_codon:yes gene_type:complete
MNFLNNLNIIQKIFLFILSINLFLGIPLYNELGFTIVDLSYGYFWKEVFVWEYSGFWWSVNIVLLIGSYLFKNNEK